MVQTCYICKWRADKEPRRSFHKFPFDETEKQKWLDIIGKSNVSLGKRTSVCSIHFEKSCYRYGLVNGRELLRPGSIPTIQLTKPPEPDLIAELYPFIPMDEDDKLEPEEYSEWNAPAEANTTTTTTTEDDKGLVTASIENNHTADNDAVQIVIELVPEVQKEKSKRRKAVKAKARKVKTKAQFKSRDKKPSHVRELVERLRQEHVKLKNYIQSLEEKQNKADRSQSAKSKKNE